MRKLLLSVVALLLVNPKASVGVRSAPENTERNVERW
jgi:hypothetical protein